MSADPVSNSPATPKKKRVGCLGCLAWIGAALVGFILLCYGFSVYRDHQHIQKRLHDATVALLANDPASALQDLYHVHEQQPDDAGTEQLYQDAQRKWIEALDQQFADKTPVQRYVMLNQDSVADMRRILSEPHATTLQQFIDRNAEDARGQIDETVEQAMDLVDTGKFGDGWKMMETLRGCRSFPGLNELWQNFDAFYTERLLIYAGDLGQHEQIVEARALLERLKKNQHPAAPAGSQTAALFRIDLGDYLLHLNQATIAAAKNDPQTAQTRLQEAQVLFSQLLGNPELQNFFAALPPKDRGSPLVNQFNATQAVVRKAAEKVTRGK